MTGLSTRVEPRERLKTHENSYKNLSTSVKFYFSLAPVTIQLSEENIENIGPACAVTVRSNVLTRQIKTNPVILPV